MFIVLSSSWGLGSIGRYSFFVEMLKLFIVIFYIAFIKFVRV